MTSRQSTLLLVSDADGASGKVAAFLESMNFRVVQCERAIDAVQLAYEVRPDAVLLKQSTRELPADSVCAMLKTQAGNDRSPLILLSTCPRGSRPRSGRAVASCDYVLPAPFDPMDLYKTVVGAIRRARDRDAAGFDDSFATDTNGDARTEEPRPAENERRPNGKPPRAPFELDGQILRLPVPRLLHGLLKYRMTGRLALTRSDDLVAVRMIEGRPVKVRSSYIPEVSLGRIMVDDGMIADAERRRIWTECCAAGTRFGAKLIERGVLDAATLDTLIRRQSREKIALTFGEPWRDGTYRFGDGATGREEMFPVDDDPGSLIIAGIRTRYSADRVASFFDRKERMESPILRNERPVYNVRQLDLSAWEKKILASIGTGHTPADVVAASGGDRTRALNFLYALAVLDIVRIAAAVL